MECDFNANKILIIILIIFISFLIFLFFVLKNTVKLAKKNIELQN